MIEMKCSVQGCQKDRRAKSYCHTHYVRQWKYGRITLSNAPENVLDRFYSRIDRDSSGCWLWLGPKNTKGYGHFLLDGKMVMAHRYSYESLVGVIPTGLQIDHLCFNKSCVNPKHLEPVTNRENCSRAKARFRNLPTGVYLSKPSSGRYVAAKQVNGHTYYIGTFGTPEDASIAYQTLTMGGLLNG